MIEWFQHLDQRLFHQINQVWTHPILDQFFVTITLAHKNHYFLYYILPVILIFWFYKERTRALKILLCLGLSILISDGLSHRVIKPLIKRPRPQHVQELTGAILKLDYSPGGYSFTSNHATNNFAGAMVLSAFYPQLRVIFFAYAALVAYSRPYVGVHYPSDIFCGALLGILLGFLLNRYLFTRWIRNE
ncbi:MAG: phosphatase PAP2 family protein [Bdellovibrionales bacterium]|nr:phosphatase PAP2 family protein [Bdellovibrionales bacterium]